MTTLQIRWCPNYITDDIILVLITYSCWGGNQLFFKNHIYCINTSLSIKDTVSTTKTPELYISSWTACSFIGNGSFFSSLSKLFHSLTALNRKLLWPDKVLHKGICSNCLFLVTRSWSSTCLLNSSHRYGGASPFMHYFYILSYLRKAYSLNALTLLIHGVL
jgi:hypothetical protein